MSTDMNLKTTWDDVRAEWSKAGQMGYQAVIQAAKVGQLLIDMKGDEPIREFVQRAGQELEGMSRSTINDLMNLAQHRDLIAVRQPESKRAALALIRQSKRPPTPQRSSAAIAQIKKEAAESRQRYASKGGEEERITCDDRVDSNAYDASEGRGWLRDSVGDAERAAVGVFTEVEYQLIHDCLDPDREVEVERKAKAFRLFRARRELLVCPCIDEARLDGGVGEVSSCARPSGDLDACGRGTWQPTPASSTSC